MTEELTPRYKIVVVGDGAAGKERVLIFSVKYLLPVFSVVKSEKKQTILISEYFFLHYTLILSRISNSL